MAHPTRFQRVGFSNAWASPSAGDALSGELVAPSYRKFGECEATQIDLPSVRIPSFFFWV